MFFGRAAGTLRPKKLGSGTSAIAILLAVPTNAHFWMGEWCPNVNSMFETGVQMLPNANSQLGWKSAMPPCELTIYGAV